MIKERDKRLGRLLEINETKREKTKSTERKLISCSEPRRDIRRIKEKTKTKFVKNEMN